MYSSNLYEDKVSGHLIIYQDSVRFYTHDNGYQSLPLMAVNTLSEKKNEISKGVYLLKKDETFVTIHVHRSYIEYLVKEPGKHEYIRVKRKKQ